ncbi:TetR/AcrR family transcriptional regulator [Kitasatospora sp. GP82]|uniref:TetR/AcrR family transcriptional regulator n=1 Tax=Kitasatospora sp. GP82 TaxID=3035089 RepID=UPI002476E9C5|nr:TetR/AcrR family transcriptional regulator [Kitasatospora sp. GP82]
MAASSAITPDSAAEADAPRPALGPTTMPTAGGGAAAHTGGAVSRAGADNTTRAGGSADSASAEPRARRSGYRRLPVQQRREQLIAVALELFSTRPPEEVGLDDVAEAAGASRPLVYRYFSGGKQQLYEAALRSAAEDLTNSFSLPAEGTPTEQLSSVLDRYFGFVAEHGTGYGALLRGGSVVETARTSAIVDEVRRVALRRTLRHLGVREAGPRLTLLVRSWISVVEASALSWLDEGRQIPKESLCAWLVDEFVAMSAATAVHDGQTAEVLAGLLALESADGPAAAMVVRLGRLRVGPPTARR